MQTFFCLLEYLKLWPTSLRFFTGSPVWSWGPSTFSTGCALSDSGLPVSPQPQFSAEMRQRHCNISSCLPVRSSSREERGFFLLHVSFSRQHPSSTLKDVDFKKGALEAFGCAILFARIWKHSFLQTGCPTGFSFSSVVFVCLAYLCCLDSVTMKHSYAGDGDREKADETPLFSHCVYPLFWKIPNPLQIQILVQHK